MSKDNCNNREIFNLVRASEILFTEKKSLKEKIILKVIKHLDFFFKQYGFNHSQDRAKMVYYCCLYFGILDDIVDGTEKISEFSSFEDEKKHILDFLNQRKEYLESNCSKSNNIEIDMLLKKTMLFAEKIGIEIKDEILALFSSLQFDILRRSDISKNQIILSEKKDIEKYSFKAFADSCHKCMVKVTDGNLLDQEKIYYLAYAHRIWLNLDGFFEDYLYGLINISKEDTNSFNINERDLAALMHLPANLARECMSKGITHPDVRKYISEEIYAWICFQLIKGEDLLNKWKINSKVPSLKDSINDLLISKQSPDDTLLMFIYGADTSYNFKKLSKHL